MATGVGINELLSTIQKSGLPLTDSFQMQQSDPIAQGQLSQTIRSQNTRLPQLNQARKDALAKISQMDQKLAGVYGDPSSKLYIEHAGQRERALVGPENTGYKVANTYGQAANQEENAIEQQANEAYRVYKNLVSVQIREEKRAEKLTKEAAKGTKTTKTATGRLLPQAKLTAAEKLAGFKDLQAAQFWNNIKETDFKRLWTQNVIEDGIPEAGFSLQDVKDFYGTWKDEINPVHQANKKAATEAAKGKATRQPLF